ncbi:hypothetical protein [Streptomyces chryseus]|uniref:Uncharacterized protein n=1 Tax=Streptomyces chryseus TaxID=68186 RepID=A0ABQ3E5T0_9ACTN|nr:hypothetical protein [Streptomyces chryseus]GHB26811.1 hypothetical protein GCM10010346_57990 [Streptomyces chryseus]
MLALARVLLGQSRQVPALQLLQRHHGEGVPQHVRVAGQPHACRRARRFEAANISFRREAHGGLA